ncbi:hypothetical protein EMB92_03460 [Bifidobacterium callitrichos]|uniref:Zinc-ribbon domain-containing protein n=1 Tax=Bifidobacterium callitrichos TaxID=762209 RepID=A0A5M9ZET3_9BIFI|nr:zinc ribbon domain-containing protein [Bifidobacterium callitrichos]KAA8817614.1 hypothetical protein EMB92_03460 [Bifidobacterium callitrichos]
MDIKVDMYRIVAGDPNSKVEIPFDQQGKLHADNDQLLVMADTIGIPKQYLLLAYAIRIENKGRLVHGFDDVDAFLRAAHDDPQNHLMMPAMAFIMRANKGKDIENEPFRMMELTVDFRQLREWNTKVMAWSAKPFDIPQGTLVADPSPVTISNPTTTTPASQPSSTPFKAFKPAAPSPTLPYTATGNDGSESTTDKTDDEQYPYLHDRKYVGMHVPSSSKWMAILYTIFCTKVKWPLIAMFIIGFIGFIKMGTKPAGYYEGYDAGTIFQPNNYEYANQQLGRLAENWGVGGMTPDQVNEGVQNLRNQNTPLFTLFAFIALIALACMWAVGYAYACHSAIQAAVLYGEPKVKSFFLDEYVKKYGEPYKPYPFIETTLGSGLPYRLSDFAKQYMLSTNARQHMEPVLGPKATDWLLDMANMNMDDSWTGKVYLMSMLLKREDLKLPPLNGASSGPAFTPAPQQTPHSAAMPDPAPAFHSAPTPVMDTVTHQPTPQYAPRPIPQPISRSETTSALTPASTTITTPSSVPMSEHPEQAQFKFCAYCGTKLKANAKFCSACGKKTLS